MNDIGIIVFIVGLLSGISSFVVGILLGQKAAIQRERQYKSLLLTLSLEALKQIVADHDERVQTWPEIETQPNKVEVMERARNILKSVDQAEKGIDR